MTSIPIKIPPALETHIMGLYIGGIFIIFIKKLENLRLKKELFNKNNEGREFSCKRLDFTETVSYNKPVVKYSSLHFGEEAGTVAKNLEISLLLDFYGDILTEKQRDVVALYYNEDLSLAEIAENEGITRQGVRDAIKRAEFQMLELEEKLGLAKKFRTINEGLEKIRNAAREIEIYNDKYYYSRDISDRVHYIEQIAGLLAE